MGTLYVLCRQHNLCVSLAIIVAGLVAQECSSYEYFNPGPLDVSSTVAIYLHLPWRLASRNQTSRLVK